jgi:hypothetical protein
LQSITKQTSDRQNAWRQQQLSVKKKKSGKFQSRWYIVESGGKERSEKLGNEEKRARIMHERQLILAEDGAMTGMFPLPRSTH